ncbi:MAG: hypothetical protein K5881_06590, partial [Saccharofermentans sp.]|nr:hypothetical protein [Saccharofermentans sp.]
SITRTSQYIPGTGMIESTPKSDSSVRTIPITENLIKEFKLYREWQDNEAKTRAINNLNYIYNSKD